MSEVTWGELTEKQQEAVRLAYIRPDRTVTSRDISGAVGRVLVGKGLFASNQPSSGAYYMPYTLTAFGCDIYERGNAKPLPENEAQQPPATEAGGEVSDPAEQLKWSRDALDEADKRIKALEAERDALMNERNERRFRIMHLRRALKSIETTSGDGNSVLDAKEALEQDFTLAAKEAKPVGKAG